MNWSGFSEVFTSGLAFATFSYLGFLALVPAGIWVTWVRSARTAALLALPGIWLAALVGIASLQLSTQFGLVVGIAVLLAPLIQISAHIWLALLTKGGRAQLLWGILNIAIGFRAALTLGLYV